MKKYFVGGYTDNPYDYMEVRWSGNDLRFHLSYKGTLVTKYAGYLDMVKNIDKDIKHYFIQNENYFVISRIKK